MSDLYDVAGGFILAVSKLRRRLQQLPVEPGVTMPEMTALVRLDRFGPQTGSELAKAEQISPQSMGATIAAPEAYAMVQRAADPTDGRRVLWSLTEAGREVVLRKRGVRTAQVAAALASLDAADVKAIEGAIAAMERLVAEL